MHKAGIMVWQKMATVVLVVKPQLLQYHNLHNKVHVAMLNRTLCSLIHLHTVQPILGLEEL